MKKLAIIHFNPVELYPPVLNWLNYLATHSGDDLQVRVFTTQAALSFQKFKADDDRIKIVRLGNLKKQAAPLRYANYFFFYATATAKLAAWKPDSVLYYETVSAWPAFAYKKYFSRKARLLVHYHEYISAAEYANGILLNRSMHGLEKKNYPSVNWLSHTNADRMKFFMADNKNVPTAITHILPNYPPRSWEKRTSWQPVRQPVKFMYTGALNADTMYVKEFASWVIAQQGRVVWDIYSSNIPAATMAYLDSLTSSHIRFMGSIDYFSLPGTLDNYDVGIILYKGHIPNYVFNAPNKLFEYFAAGLDTWFPQLMQSSLPYTVTESYPKIIPVDFENLQALDLSAMTNREGLDCKPSGYYCENVFGDLLEEGLGISLADNNNAKPERI